MAGALIYNARLSRRERIFAPRVGFEGLESTDELLISKYRLPRAAIVSLHDILVESLTPMTGRSHSIPAITKILVGLRYVAKGDFLSEVAQLHGVSKSSGGVIVTNFIDAVNSNLKNIRFPSTREDVNSIKMDFYRKSRIPNIIGAIDGTLVPIVAPVAHEEAFVCRKGFHALNVQAVCDHNMRFTNVVSMWPGSHHDSSIWNTCGLKEYLDNENLGMLLGDSGYPLKKNLLTPKLRPTCRKEELFNIQHSRGRMVIERAFGVLKSRFRCLHKTGGALPFTPEKSARVVTACARLHNFCLDWKIPAPEIVVPLEENHPALDIPEGADVFQFRQNIVNLFQD